MRCLLSRSGRRAAHLRIDCRTSLATWTSFVKRTTKRGRGNLIALDAVGRLGENHARTSLRLARLLGEPGMEATAPRKPYASDLTDPEWALLQPLLPAPLPAGAPATTDLRPALAPLPPRPARLPRRHPLSPAQRLRLSRPAPRLPPGRHRPRLLPPLAPLRPVAADQRRLAPPGPPGRGPGRGALGRHHRQPVGQGHAHQR